MKAHHPVVIGLKAMLLLNVANSQTPPDAGTLQQQMRRERELSLPRRSISDKSAPIATPPVNGVNVTVTEFRFDGNNRLSSEQLARATASYLKRPLDFAHLQEAAAAVANAYRAAGWFARAYLPEQDIQNGIVTIAVLEATFGTVITAEFPTRVESSIILGYFSSQQGHGQPMQMDKFDRALLLADDLPGVTAAGALRPGAKAQETDLVLKLSDEPAMQGTVALDNSGAHSTGSDRSLATLIWLSPRHRGDQLDASALHTVGSDFLQMAYSLPVGFDGWRIGLSASQFRYQLVSSAFAALDAVGTASSFGVEASYPLIRTRARNLYVHWAYDRKYFCNEANASLTSNYLTEAFGASLAGNDFDQWGNASSGLLNITTGQVNLNGSPNQATDAMTTQTQGSFTKLRYNLGREQLISPGLVAFTNLSGQWANTNLDSSEKMYLGGMHGVRAYPANEGGGAIGQILNLELRQKLMPQLMATAFYDWGRVTQNVDNNFAGAVSSNSLTLRGHGMGLEWQANRKFRLQGIWAHRTGSNPNATALGTDQDGTLATNRWWLLASLGY
jgi:hemolysin activation/secretion protein